MTELLVLNDGQQELQAVSLDGTRVRTLVAGLDELPDGIVVDQARGHVYWTNMGTPDAGSTGGDLAYTRNGSLERADLDGGNRVTIVPRGAFTTGKQLTADFDDGVLYWCDREGTQVLRCDLDGSELRPLVITAVGDEAAHLDRNHCVGIAVDLHRRLLYWTQKGAPNAGEGRIFRAPLDLPAGTSARHRDDIELLLKDLPEPIDLHLLGDGATLVWTDRGDEPEGNTLNRATVAPAIDALEILSPRIPGGDRCGRGLRLGVLRRRSRWQRPPRQPRHRRRRRAGAPRPRAHRYRACRTLSIESVCVSSDDGRSVLTYRTHCRSRLPLNLIGVHREGTRDVEMNWLINLWQNLTSAQATLLGGSFVLLAGIIAFGTGALERRSRHKRFHYQELKTLYAEALKIGRDFELLKAVPPDDRGPILTETVAAMQQVISELALTGNFQTADLAIAYTYQQSVQLAGWTREVESDVGWPDQFQKWLDSLTDEERAALKRYSDVNINRRDVVQAARKELASYVPVWSRHRCVLRKTIEVNRFALN